MSDIRDPRLIYVKGAKFVICGVLSATLLIGAPRADDQKIMAWAIKGGYVVCTPDLDFAATLALTAATGPSVIQVRGPHVLPEDIGPIVVAAIRQHEALLAGGALAIIDPTKVPVRLLPLNCGPYRVRNFCNAVISSSS